MHVLPPEGLPFAMAVFRCVWGAIMCCSACRNEWDKRRWKSLHKIVTMCNAIMHYDLL